ncbi:MAG: acyl-CoA dehydrogenase family protein [Candidatus Nanopelagicales bacterium]
MNPVGQCVGPADSSAGEAAVIDRVAEFANRTLVPHANRIDRRGIGRPHLDELAGTGAFGLPFPADLGGLEADRAVVREATELIAGACGTTWFCFAQHRSPTTAVMNSQNSAVRDRWLRRMVAGEAISGIAFAHLRRPKQRFWIRDEGDSFVLNGALDWVTTWPLADVVLIEGYAQTREGEQRDEIISILVEPPRVDLSKTNLTDREDIQAGPSLALAAMGGTRTWPVAFGGFRVAADQLVSRKSADQWLAENALVSADANPAGFGIARAAINEMAGLGDVTSQPGVVAAARELAEELVELRARAYAAADAAADDREVATASIGDRTVLRAAALNLNLRATSALVAASGGAAMMLSSNAQRRAREALFLLVQGQTADLRTASIGLLTS